MLANDCRLVDEHEHGKLTGRRRSGHGDSATSSRSRFDAPFGLWQSVRQRALPTGLGKTRHTVQYEPCGKLLRQCPMESFWDSLKKELVYREPFETIELRL